MTNSIKEFKPTYLYIKQHKITEKLYFGKTIRKDVEKYNGSGSRWNNHIAYHGKEHVETVWYCLFYDEESIKEFALMCSEQWQIVKSDKWLNFIPENGTTGAKPDTKSGMTGKRHSEETKEKLRLANLGKKASEETKLKMSGKGHKQSEETILKIKQKQTGVKRGSSKIVKCPHCDMSGGENNMIRYHFDNCNEKPGQTKITLGPMNGKRHTKESNEKNRQSQLGKRHGPDKITECPHCHKTGGYRAMNQWHFDKCKFKVTSTNV